MTKVLAAIDNSAAARPVLSTAIALGDAFGSDVEALHVRTDGDRLAASEAAAAGVPFRETGGVPAERLVDAGNRDDVAALVIGARGSRFGRHPVGGTAAAVATRVRTPVVVVPPDAANPGQLRRVLVPLEGTVSTSLAPRTVIELARDAQIEVVVLHVLDEASLPSFTDQPQHEETAWADEFLARYCPWGTGMVALEVRVGRREAVVPAVAADVDADLIALGWSCELAAGRAPVVRTVLEQATIPVMLVPVTAPEGDTTPRTAEEARWRA